MFFKWALPVSFFFSLYIFFFSTVNSFIIKFCRWLDSNCRPLVSEATALSTWATTTAILFCFYLHLWAQFFSIPNVACHTVERCRRFQLLRIVTQILHLGCSPMATFQLAWNNSNLFCSSDWVTHTCVKLRSFRWESSFTYPEAKLTKILKNAVTVIVGVIKWSDWFSLVTWCRLTNQIPECHSVSLHCLFENEPNHDFYWGSFTPIAEIEDLNHFRIYSNLTHYTA